MPPRPSSSRIRYWAMLLTFMRTPSFGNAHMHPTARASTTPAEHNDEQTPTARGRAGRPLGSRANGEAAIGPAVFDQLFFVFVAFVFAAFVLPFETIEAFGF